MCVLLLQAKFHTASPDNKRNILNKSMMGGHSTAEALSANKRSTTMATGTAIALPSPHMPSNASMHKNFKNYFELVVTYYYFTSNVFGLRPLIHIQT